MIPGRKVGYQLGILLGATLLVWLLLPQQAAVLAAGPLTAGHDNVECQRCHQPAAGTIRQQLQANTRYLLGVREHAVPFVYRNVTNDECRVCHDNPADAHPTHRFEEPRFADARDALGPTKCTNCHREHSGRRVSAEDGFCKHCHQDIQLKDDPVEPSHAMLAKQEQWTSCLRCHDFHANHLHNVPQQLSDALEPGIVSEYLRSGPRAYGDELRYPAQNPDAVDDSLP